MLKEASGVDWAFDSLPLASHMGNLVSICATLRQWKHKCRQKKEVSASEDI